ncbi:MAG: 4Fe-4S dicluster domain-containing protein [Dehalococcoidales bacterium]|nr:4Fe-4S dicluster domain-containing protein [Dehalococcoidales bacterium]
MNMDSIKEPNTGEISRRDLLKMAVPFGKIKMESARCTGCGICAAECPTGALTISADKATGAVQMLFRQQVCIACNKCVEVCPEHCLSLERGLEVEKIGSPAAVLYEDEIARCAECGAPIGPRAMINSVKAKIAAAGQPALNLEICPDCKIKAQLRKQRVQVSP